MNRTLLTLFAAASLMSVPLLGACKLGEVEDDDGFVGGAGGLGGDGGSGAGAEGGSGGSGAAGGGDCVPCSEYFTSTSEICPESEATLQAVTGCVCSAGICDAACEEMCTGSGEITEDCDACLMTEFAGTCSSEYGECANDI